MFGGLGDSLKRLKVKKYEYCFPSQHFTCSSPPLGAQEATAFNLNDLQEDDDVDNPKSTAEISPHAPAARNDDEWGWGDEKGEVASNGGDTATPPLPVPPSPSSLPSSDPTESASKSNFFGIPAPSSFNGQERADSGPLLREQLDEARGALSTEVEQRKKLQGLVLQQANEQVRNRDSCAVGSNVCKAYGALLR